MPSLPPHPVPIPVNYDPFNPANVVFTWNFSSPEGHGQFASPGLFGGAQIESLQSVSITLWYASAGSQSPFPIYSVNADGQIAILNGNGFAGFTVQGMSETPIAPTNVQFTWHYTNPAGKGQFSIPGLIQEVTAGLSDLQIILWYVSIGSEDFPIYSFTARYSSGVVQYGIMNANRIAGFSVSNMLLNIGTGSGS